MKKRLFFGGLLIVICLVGIFTYRSFFVPTSNTIESREKILNESLSKGKEWSIAKEIKIDSLTKQKILKNWIGSQLSVEELFENQE